MTGSAAMSLELGGLYFDWSKTHLDAELLGRFVKVAEAAEFAAAREALFSGAIVNPTEGRAAEHVVERGTGDADAVELSASRRSRMRALVDAIEAGAFGDVTGVLHIGIGGSVLGPALLVDALGRRGSRLDVRFLSNIDGEAFDDAVKTLDPATTLVVTASKTFTTAETLANMNAAIDWLRAAGVDDPFGRVIAVTARPEAALEAGIDETRILQFSEGVGTLFLVERGRPVRGAGAWLERVRGTARRCGRDGPPLPLCRAGEERAADRGLHRPPLRPQVRMPDARGLRL